MKLKNTHLGGAIGLGVMLGSAHGIRITSRRKTKVAAAG